MNNFQNIQEREHARFEEKIAGLKSQLISPASEWFLDSVLGVLRGYSKFWSDVSVEHSQSVVDTALAVLGSLTLFIPERDRVLLFGFFNYRESDD